MALFLFLAALGFGTVGALVILWQNEGSDENIWDFRDVAMGICSIATGGLGVLWLSQIEVIEGLLIYFRGNGRFVLIPLGILMLFLAVGVIIRDRAESGPWTATLQDFWIIVPCLLAGLSLGLAAGSDTPLEERNQPSEEQKQWAKKTCPTPTGYRWSKVNSWHIKFPPPPSGRVWMVKKDTGWELVRETDKRTGMLFVGLNPNIFPAPTKIEVRTGDYPWAEGQLFTKPIEISQNTP